MRREVLTCDVCGRELPLRKLRGQRIYTVQQAFHFPGAKPDEKQPEHICTECWDVMVDTAREVRASALAAPGGRPGQGTPP